MLKTYLTMTKNEKPLGDEGTVLLLGKYTKQII
jgi:hypothetical protein